MCSTENIAKPCTIHAPGICRKRRHAAARGMHAADVARRFRVAEQLGVAVEVVAPRQPQHEPFGLDAGPVGAQSIVRTR